eukprot:gene5856-7285_t
MSTSTTTNNKQVPIVGNNGSTTIRQPDEWTNVFKTGVVLFPFNATHKFQLPLTVGDFVQIHAQTSEQAGWYSGVSVTTQESGIFPQTYVVILPEQNPDDLSSSSSTSTTNSTITNTNTPSYVPICSKLNLPNEEMGNSALVNEITSTIVEWATLLKIFTQNKQYNDFRILSQRITTLVQFRNQILSLTSPREITYEIRDKVLNVIDEGRRETGLSIILRKEIPNIYSMKSNNVRNSTTSLPSSTVATDLILADAENTGVFTLCTMYQEKKLLSTSITSSNRLLESAKKDDHHHQHRNHLNNSSSFGSSSSSSTTTINNNNIQNNQQQQNNIPNNQNLSNIYSPSPLSFSQSLPSNINSVLVTSNSSGSSSQSSSSSASPNSSSISVLSQSSGKQDQAILSSSPGGSSFLNQSILHQSQQLNSSSTTPSPTSSSLSVSTPIQQQSSSSSSSSKLSKLPSSINFLSSVRLKNKSSLQSSTGISNSSNSSGGGSGSNLNVQQQQQQQQQQMQQQQTNGNSAVSQSYISVTSQSPTSSSTNSNNTNGANGNSNLSLSSLSLNSPILSNSPTAKKSIGAMKGPIPNNVKNSSNRQGGSFISSGGSSSSSQSSTEQGSTFSKSNIQLLVSLNNFLYSSGENLDIVFSIYSKSESKFITESYCGIVPPTGIFMEPENPNERIRTIFKDLETKDLSTDLYLVAKLYRKTSSVSSKDPNSSPTLSRSTAMAPPQVSLNGSGSGSSLFQQSSASSKLFKKYIGCGVKKLEFNCEGTFEIMLTLYTSSNEGTFYNLHESVISEVSGAYEPITRAKGVVCTLKLFNGDYQQFLSENLEYRTISTSLKLQLPEVILPGSDRNDMYVQIEEGDFSDKNIEVTMQIKTDSGLLLHDAIKFANGQPESSEHRTPLISSNLCRWNDIVKVWMAAKTFERAHIFFLIRQCSEKKDKERVTVAYGYLKFLNDEGAVIKDGSHVINLYKTSTDDVPIASYINGVVDPSQKEKASSKKLDTLKIRTTFVSTCLTQNPLVVNLSRWQSFQGDLSSLIKDITFLGQQDIIRNLQEIFYNFLSILDQQLNDSPLSMEIFRAFVFIIGVLVDSRTTNYRPALDLYVSKYFGMPLGSSSSNTNVGISAHSHLLRSVVKNLENFQEPSNASRISSSLKALEYIFKMVVASKTKFSNKETEGNESYQNNLKNVVDILCEIMISNSPSLIGAQTIALKNFETMFGDLKQFFTVEDMSIIALKFMKSIQHLEKNKTFNLLKLKLLSSYINGPMMLNKETRKQLHPIVFQLIQFHFGKSIEETDMTLTLLGLVVDIMITKSELRGKDKDAWLLDMMGCFVPVLELLQLLNSNIPTNSNNRERSESIKRRSFSSASLNGASNSVSLATMVSTMSEENQNDLRIKVYAFMLGTARLAGVQHWEMFNKTVSQTSKTFFVDLYDSLQILFDSPKFPTDFWTFTVFQLKTILRMTRILEDVSFYTPSSGNKDGDNQFDLQLWKSFFLMTSTYLNCKDMQFESVNPAKAVFLKARCGDVRIEMARVFERVWTTVPVKERSSFIPTLINPIIKLSINDTLDAKRVATKIFFDMLESEIMQTESYTQLFERTLDALVELGTCGSSVDGSNWPNMSRGPDGKLPFTLRSFSTFFNTQCMALVLSKSSDTIKKKAEAFIKEINQFLHILITFMNDIKNQDEEEIFASSSRLIFYLQEHKRTIQFIRFIHMVSKRHYANGNYIESAVTLMLHASLYQWDHNKIINSIQNEYASFPTQKESERKEMLYRDILTCYNKGKAWERAIPLLKELIHHFTMNICDMNSAATYLRQQGTFYQKINDSPDPVFEEYFRVGYYGKKFPVSIQNKEFIYKGNEYERLADFISKLVEKWPSAELLKTTEIPPQTIMDSDAQYLLITSVSVSNMAETQKRQSINITPDSFTTTKKRLPHRVQQFNARNKVNVFLYSKPFKKSNTKSQNEFEDLWIMNLYLICDKSFPSTERRSLICERRQIELSPIENALNTVVQKNEELLSRIDKYQANPQETLSPLTMTLNGVIDASVNGGISRYETFISDEYLKTHPDYKQYAELLKSAMDQQLIVVEQALKLHGTLRPPEMAAMQEKLETLFNTMKLDRLKN